MIVVTPPLAPAPAFIVPPLLLKPPAGAARATSAPSAFSTSNYSSSQLGGFAAACASSFLAAVRRLTRGSLRRRHAGQGSRRRRTEVLTAAAQMSEMRAGDLGENAGESFFPKESQEIVAATGEAVATEPSTRIGHGYDIHRMLPKEDLEGWGVVKPQPAVVGGVVFDDFPLGVVAHSDGDVVYHSTTDAILGALGLPDIGQLFPDNDPRWRGANSEIMFDEAVRLMDLRGYRVSNVDVTIIAEGPRMAARKAEMKANVVRLCHTVPARVNIKARTHEKVDAVGECRALECHVCILLERSK